MKIQIVKNKYLNSLFLLMLGSAIVHMAILFFIAIWTGDLYFLNYFNILSISYFIPNFLNSIFGDIVSFLFALIVYVIILKVNKE
jgi:hypothetical protein